MIDEESIRLGHLLLTNSGMKLEIDGNAEKRVLRFIGPKQFMKSSQLVLRDPSGRALWKKDLTGIKMQSKKIPTKIEGVRNEIRILEESEDAESILASLSETVFFNYCLFHENEMRRFNICSTDYNLTSKDGDWQLKPVKSNEEENRFMVNGVEVGSEGEIQFSKEITSLSLSAKLLSGLLVEIKTREVPITLVDYEYIPDKSIIKLRVRENVADPLYDEGREWVPEIQLKKPFFYIEAENQISLKQELVVEGELLSEFEKPKFRFPQDKTYSATVYIELAKKEGDAFKALSKGDIVINKTTSSVWQIKNLKPTLNTPHLIEFRPSSTKNVFVGSYGIIRGSPWDARVLAHFKSRSLSNETENATIIGSAFNLNYYFSDFLFLAPSSWNHMKWAIYSEVINEKITQGEEKEQVLITSLDLVYRFQDGIHHTDSAWAIAVGYLNRGGKVNSQSGLAFSVMYSDPLANLGALGDKIFVRLKYLPSYLDSKKLLKAATLTQVSFESRNKITSSLDWSWTISNLQENLKLADSTGISTSELGLGIGINKTF
jgi:hypothetical protein